MRWYEHDSDMIQVERERKRETREKLNSKTTNKTSNYHNI